MEFINEIFDHINEKYKNMGSDGELIISILNDSSNEIIIFLDRIKKYLTTLEKIDKQSCSILLRAIITIPIFSFTKLNAKQTFEILDIIENKVKEMK